MSSAANNEEEQKIDIIVHYERTVKSLRARIAELEAQINTPEVIDFIKGVQIEAAHQRMRWGAEHDESKGREDWFWTLSYLAGKVLRAQAIADSYEETAGKVDDEHVKSLLRALAADHRGKALHHIVSSGALCANWHLYQGRKT